MDRLNKVVGGSSTTPSDHNAATNRKPSSLSIPPQASVAERKKQLAQLAEMGIAVPDEFHGDMAMAGDWKVVSQRPVEGTTSEDPLSIGVRKRKFEGQEGEEEAGEIVARRGWGSTSRRYPGADEGAAPNLDALLSGVKSGIKEEAASELKKEGDEEKSALLSAKDESLDTDTKQAEKPKPIGSSPAKKEESTDASEPAKSSLHDIPSAEEALGAGVIFKKRKPKSIQDK